MAEWRERRRQESAVEREETYRHAERLLLTEVREIKPLAESARLGVAHDGRLIIASGGTDSGSNEFPTSQLPGVAGAFDVSILGADGSREKRHFDGVPHSCPLTQLTPSGELLTIGMAPRLSDSTRGDNASIIAEDGSVVGSFAVGGSVSDAQVTPGGRLWIGYTDKGIYGGGDLAGSVEQFIRTGIVCWGLDGQPQYAFERPEGFGPVDHLYAMCAVGEEAWAYYYNSFPIVRISEDFDVVGWESGITGAKHMAVWANTVLLAGGWRAFHDRAVILDTNPEGTLYSTMIFQLSMPDGSDLPEYARLAGRGSALHVVVDDLWMQLDLKQPLRTA